MKKYLNIIWIFLEFKKNFQHITNFGKNYKNSCILDQEDQVKTE